MTVIKNGGSFQSFPDVNGNPLISINRDGSVLAQSIAYGDGTSQTTAPVSVVNSATVTLSSAQLKALNTTPVVLIPAQGAGTLIVPTAEVFDYKFGTVQYSGNGGLRTRYTGDTNNLFPPSNSNIVSAAQSVFYINGGPGTTGTGTLTLNRTVGNNVSVETFNGGAAYTLGDGTLNITILYQVITLS